MARKRVSNHATVVVGGDFSVESGRGAAFGDDGFDLREEWLEAGAVGGVCVVDAAVDGVADDAFGVKVAADGISFHAEAD